MNKCSSPTLIELSAKRYKLMRLVAAGILILGAALCVTSFFLASGSYTLWRVGLVLFLLIGPVVWKTSDLLSWWNHG